jgi:hypothetical protein
VFAIYIDFRKNGFIKICDSLFLEGAAMGSRKKEKHAKINLLEISVVERSKTIEKAKESLRQKVAEAKLWHSLLALENITVNGETINCGDYKLTGLSLNEI